MMGKGCCAARSDAHNRCLLGSRGNVAESAVCGNDSRAAFCNARPRYCGQDVLCCACQCIRVNELGWKRTEPVCTAQSAVAEDDLGRQELNEKIVIKQSGNCLRRQASTVCALSCVSACVLCCD
jgi:hypothetical protein